MNHVMIDLETLGTAPGCAVLTIGAVRFDPEVDDFANLTPDQILALPPERAFYARIERESCAVHALAEDPETLAWWDRQSSAARFEAFDAWPRFGIECVIANFADWCRAIGPEVTPWSHGAVFDIAQLEHLFRRFAIPCPWDFRNVRDTRTLYAFAGVKPERNANHHHALFDAVAQARAVIAAHRNRADDEYMRRLGHAVMDRIAEHTKDAGGPLEDWTPAECPSEVINDLVDMIESLRACDTQPSDARVYEQYPGQFDAILAPDRTAQTKRED